MGRSYCIQYCLRYCLWCFSPKCTLYTCGKYCGTMNDDNLESKALCKVQKFHECSFCSNRRHAAGKLLVYIYISILIKHESCVCVCVSVRVFQSHQKSQGDE